MEVQSLPSVQLQALKAHSCKFHKQGMQQFLTLMKYKNVFFIPYDSQFRFEVSELLLRLWSGQAKRNRVFEIRKPGRCFIQKKKESERGREGKKPYSCVWLKNKTAALSEPLKSPSPVIVSRHLQLEAARMFVVVLKASQCGFHMVYFYFYFVVFFFPNFFSSPFGASSSCSLRDPQTQPTLLLHGLWKNWVHVL